LLFGLPSWLLIFPVLGFLVFIHELGHFVTAKLFGIKVLEFGFGFPLRMVGFTYRGTIYSLNWLPFGGFVKMAGEEDPTDPQSFARQHPAKRSVVLVAGSFMNFLFPIVVFTTLFTLPHDVPVGTVVITGVEPNSPAHQAGLRSQDVVLEANGAPVKTHIDLAQVINSNLGKQVQLTVRRTVIVSGLPFSPDTAPVENVTVVPRLNPPTRTVVETVTDPATQIPLVEAQRLNPNVKLGNKWKEGAVGVRIGTANVHMVKESFPIWESVPMAFGQVWEVIVLTKNGFTQWFAGGPDPGLAGPVGIAQVTGEVAEVGGLMPILELMALLSISLCIINVLPIPALDGGRLLFVVIEWVRRGKRISPEREGLVHMVGFIVLIGLIVVISYRDIIKIINGESFLR